MKITTLALSFCLASPAFCDGLNQDSPADLLNGWIGSVVSGDPDNVAAILAPEFQIMRANGVGFNALEYVSRDLPNAKAPNISGIVATQDGDHMVVRYFLEIDETIDGAVIQKLAPRLTTFRRIDGNWYVSAHANFALPE